MSNWKCSAVDHGVTVYSDGTIGPCCKISNSYRKPINELSNPDRFADLRVDTAPDVCGVCTKAEQRREQSYRNFFNSTATDNTGIQFLDIRNTNLCNLKCRYCGPHYSHQWAKELNNTIEIRTQDFTDYNNVLFTESLQWMYFTGGEPLIVNEYWETLERLIAQGVSKNISLRYNTNLSTLKYKDKNIFDIWNQFKNVELVFSIDAVGEPLSYIRSGSDWSRIKANLEEVITHNVDVCISPVVGVLNIWFLADLLRYAQSVGLTVKPVILSGPDFLGLGVIPDSLKDHALNTVTEIEKLKVLSQSDINHIRALIVNNDSQGLLPHTIAHILYLDRVRNENLFDLLPFNIVAKDIIVGKNGY